MPEHQQIEEPIKTTRPVGITIFAISVLLISIYHFTQIVQVIRNWSIILSLPLSISPVYLIMEGLAWTTAGLILCWGLLKGKKWTQRGGVVLSITYIAFSWIDQIWISENAGLSSKWPADLIISFLGLGAVWMVLNHPRSKDFLKNKSLIEYHKE